MKTGSTTSKKKTICFFVKTADPTVFERVEFYAQDIRALEDMGYEVIVAPSLRSLVGIKPEAYFVWWWTWAIFPLFLAFFTGKPIYIRGVFDEWAFDSRRLIQRISMKISLRFATRNIFVSQFEFEQIPKKMKTRNPVLIPCCVDTEVYHPCDNKKDRELLNNDSLFILTVAWLKYGNAVRKGIPELIEGFSQVAQKFPEVKLVIAGQVENDSEPLFERVRELGLASSISFPGRITLAEKISLMQTCSIYVQPSKFEGFGLAALEAMSCGASIIATRGGATPEVVGDSALLVEPTPDGIAAGVIELLGNREKRETLAASARLRATSLFSYRGHVQLLDQILTVG